VSRAPLASDVRDSAGRDTEMDSLRRSFRLGAIAVVAAIVAIGGIIAAFGTPADRPAGVAERWLVALSDTTRDGLADDALERMDELQAPSAGEAADIVEVLTSRDGVAFFFFVPALQDDGGAAEDGEARFDTVQVGRAMSLDGVLRDGTEVVPAQVTPYEADDPIDAYVVMQDGDDGWAVAGFVIAEALTDVAALAESICTPDCPGFPVERPERAAIGFWFGALLLGALITLGCSAAIRAATPKAPATIA
jgi:hypothetical protein